MSTYRKLHGRSIQAVTTDPSESVAEGQVWYNTTSDTFKSVISSSAWVSATSLPETNSNAGGAGIQTAALFFGGRSGGAQKTQTLEYNGLGYSVGGAMGTARNQMGGGGTQTAALASTGVVEGPSACPTESEEYNGTSWTAGGSLSTARFALGGAGTQTANVVAGGRLGPGTWSAVTEEYGGTSWTSGGALNQTKTLQCAMTGSLTAAVAFGGDGNPPTQAVNDLTFYDGTSWTETGNLPAANRNAGTAGPQTSAIMFGGMAPSETANAFLFDGTTFSATGSMGSATYIMAPAANASNNSTALSMGGYGGSAYLSRTEEFTSSANVITAAAFSSMGAMGTSRYGHSAAGDKDAAVVVSGRPTGPSPTTNVEEYNGSSWSEVTNVPSGKFYAGGGMGTQTASIFAGGFGSPPQGVQVTVESYDGTNWTDAPSLNTGKFSACPAGTQTAGLLAGGSPSNNTSEEFNGSSWTEGNNLTESFDDLTGAGTQTAAIAMGGSGPVFAQTDTELYDGTNWTNGPTMSQGRRRASAAGTQTDALVLAGLIPGPAATTKVEGFDGTTFSTRPSLGTSRYYGYGFSATSGNAYIAGGLTSPGAPNHTTAAEEFTVKTTALNVKTLTQS